MIIQYAPKLIEQLLFLQYFPKQLIKKALEELLSFAQGAAVRDEISRSYKSLATKINKKLRCLLEKLLISVVGTPCCKLNK